MLPLLATAWVAGASSPPPPSLSSRPNFVVIFLDDAGWGDAGFNVGPLAPETTVLDRLATEGLRFTDFHAAASVCTPSRASLLTGRLGLRTGVTTNFREGALGGLPQTEVTLAELLRDQAGYHTAMLGKWHLGTHPPFHPSYRGFDRYLGVPYSVDMGCTNVGEDHPPRLPCCQGAWTKGPPPVPNPDPEHPHRHLIKVDAMLDTSSPSAPFFAQPSPTAAPMCVEAPAVPLYNSTGPQCSSKPSCNQDITEQPVNLTSLSRRYGEFAEAFVEEQAKKNGTTRAPFFLYMALSHMHVPLAYDPRFENASSRTDRRIYGNTLAEGEICVQEGRMFTFARLVYLLVIRSNHRSFLPSPPHLTQSTSRSVALLTHSTEPAWPTIPWYSSLRTMGLGM